MKPATAASVHATIDRSLFSRWLGKIQDGLNAAHEPNVTISRFANSLQFAIDGRVFAVLRADSSGFLFREWSSNGEAEDTCGLTLTRAHFVVESCLQRRR